MRRGVRTAIAATLLLVAAGCGNDGEPSPEPTKSPSDTPTASPPETAPSATPLDWQQTGHSVEERVIVGEKWTSIATESDVRFESASDDTDDVALAAVGNATVNAVLLEDDAAVVS